MKFENVVRRNICGDGYDANERAEIIIEAHNEELKSYKEKADKYRRHDLRKDPNDLPDMYENVYVFNGSSYFVWNRSPLEDSWVWEDDYGYYIYEQDEVIAWRKIEPFL